MTHTKSKLSSSALQLSQVNCKQLKALTMALLSLAQSDAHHEHLMQKTERSNTDIF